MTTRLALLLGLGLALAVAGVASRADDAETPPAEPAVEKLANQVAKKSWADLSKEGAAVAKRFDADKIELVDVMALFRGNKGIVRGGSSGLPPPLPPKGIEARLIWLLSSRV